jgi:protein-serine/threonine kinase
MNYVVFILEYVVGGELLEVVNSDELHAKLSEALLHHTWCHWCELVSAVERIMGPLYLACSTL